MPRPPRTLPLRLCGFVAVAATACPALAGAAPPHRALWVCTEALYDQASIERLVATAAAYDVDELFVQVRRAGDAYYSSATEPRSRKLAGQPDDFDPLAETIRCARLFDIRVHAWLNVNYVWPGPEPPPAANHVARAHPNWMTVGRDARRISSYSKRELAQGDAEGWYVDPAVPAFADYFAAVAAEVAAKYDVAGIHLDFIRYPNYRFGYGENARRTYARERPGEPDPLVLGYHKMTADIYRPATGCDGLVARWFDLHALEWYDWRADQVTRTVAAAGEKVHAARPACVYSAAVWAQPEYAYRYVGQNWLGWLDAGYVDVIVPMTYWGDAKDLAATAARAARHRRDGEKVYLGIGAFNHGTDYAAAVVAGLDGAPLDGVVLFDYDACWRKPGILPALTARCPPAADAEAAACP
jgi:uncharacterized lipoprotein YddW (UPF0748 family)